MALNYLIVVISSFLQSPKSWIANSPCYRYGLPRLFSNTHTTHSGKGKRKFSKETWPVIMDIFPEDPWYAWNSLSHSRNCYYQSKILSKTTRYTMYLLEWLKSRTLTTPNSGKNVEQWELLFISGEDAKCPGHFGGPFDKTQHTLTIWSRHHAHSINLNALKTYVHTQTCIWIFVAASL